MAKLEQGYMGGFIGKLGPAVGYCWRGRWCVRALPAKVHNPRTEAQQAHRMEFREMVRLAGRFRPAVNVGLRAEAMRRGMTECNLFVHRNHRCLTSEGLDYSALQVSHGPAAPVGFDRWSVDGQGVLRVGFEKNPLGRSAHADDEVKLFVYSVDLQVGMKLQGTRRGARQVAVALPDEWVGTELQVYGFVVDRQGRVSNSSYVVKDEGDDEQEMAINAEVVAPTGTDGDCLARAVHIENTDEPIGINKKLPPG